MPLQEDQCKYPSSVKIGQNPMNAQCTNVSVDTHNAICTIHAYIQPTYLDLTYGVKFILSLKTQNTIIFLFSDNLFIVVYVSM